MYMKMFLPSMGAAGLLSGLVDAAKKNGHVQVQVIAKRRTWRALYALTRVPRVRSLQEGYQIFY